MEHRGHTVSSRLYIWLHIYYLFCLFSSLEYADTSVIYMTEVTFYLQFDSTPSHGADHCCFFVHNLCKARCLLGLVLFSFLVLAVSNTLIFW